MKKRMDRGVVARRMAALWLSIVVGVWMLGCGGSTRPSETGGVKEANTRSTGSNEPGYGYSLEDSPATGAGMPQGQPAPAPPPPPPSPVAEAARDDTTMASWNAKTAPAPSDAGQSNPSGGDSVAPAGSGQGAGTNVAGPDAASAVRAPLLIYKAELGLAVFNVQQNVDRVEQIAKEAGGYLLERRDNQITVRVPAGGFDASLKAILALGDVLSRQLSAEDVTAEYRDLEIRLRNAEVVRTRLEQLLLSAKDTKEALEVERELARVTDDIERYKGRLRMMGELVAFSTITVSLQTPQVEQVDSRFRLPFPWLQKLGLSNLLKL